MEGEGNISQDSSGNFILHKIFKEYKEMNFLPAFPMWA